jgi:hypothetical protein
MVLQIVHGDSKKYAAVSIHLQMGKGFLCSLPHGRTGDIVIMLILLNKIANNAMYGATQEGGTDCI